MRLKLAPKLVQLLAESTQVKAIVKMSSKSLIKKFVIASILLVASCASSQNKAGEPSWYISPKQNNSQNFYGVAYGPNLEEATKSALADAAARLMVSISSESTLLREEDSSGASEEMRQQVKQNIEKIDFTNFKVSRSQKTEAQLFVEVEIERDSFIRDQKEKIAISNSRGGKNQIVISIKSSSKIGEVYGAKMTKIALDFENIFEGKTIASNKIEISGSSTIRDEESYSAALKSLEDKIEKEGILKIIGIIN